MGRPVGGYRLQDGTRVPGVSTIAEYGKDAGGLIHWAWNLGMEGKDYRAARDSAASTGTLAHEMVECWVRKTEWTRPPNVTGAQVAQAGRAYGAFCEWAAQSRLEVTHSEFSLISEKYRVGGTPDAVLVNGKRAMGDWKTSNDIYPEYLVQLAGYGLLWEEAFPDEPLDGGYHLIRFGKTYGNFSHHWWADLDAAKEAFLLKRQLYDLQHVLKGMAK